jgi:carbon-monoxide dehydrogenase medium subunit
MMALRLARPEHLVDLNGVTELDSVQAIDGLLRIGAMTRQFVVGADSTVADQVPLLALATPYIGHFQIRNRGTVGGSVAHADPSAEYPTVVVALDAELEVSSTRGTRRIGAAEFFEGPMMTALGPDELLTAIRFPVWAGRSGFSFREVSRRHGDFALVGVAVGIELEESTTIRRAAIALLGVEGRPRRAPDAEAALVGTAISAVDAGEMGRLALKPLRATDDIHASAEYRRRVGAHLVSQAVEEACRRASEVDGD